MGKLFLIALALAAPLPGIAAGESAAGLWRTEKISSGAYLDVRIAPCGEALCGVIEAAHDTKKPDLVGQTLISGMVADAPGRWTSGTIVVPETNKTYAGSMWLDGGSLKVEGCVAMLCRSQVWSRLN